MNRLPPDKLLLVTAVALFLTGCAGHAVDDDECKHEANSNKSEQHACKAGAGCNQQHPSK